MLNKRIGIDARLLAQTGVGVYIKNLLLELQHIADHAVKFYVYVRDEDKNLLPKLPDNFVLKSTTAPWHSLSEQTVFLQQLLSDNLDLMHFTYFSMPILYTKPFVITIHDVIPFTHATGKASTKGPIIYKIKHFAYKKVLASAVRHAQKIFVPTNAVRDDLIKLFPHINKDAIATTYEGVDKHLINAKERPPTKTFHMPYFLYMGNYYPHKNIEFLISAFSKVEGDAHLVLCGPDDFFAKNVDAFIRSQSLGNKVMRISATTIEERAYLYRHALALVHPSKNEGFGLPLLEAAYFDCPAIVSNIPVFREVRPQASFFNLNDENELVTLMKNAIVRGTTKSNDKVAQKFSFKKMAEETYHYYRQYL